MSRVQMMIYSGLNQFSGHDDFSIIGAAVTDWATAAWIWRSSADSTGFRLFLREAFQTRDWQGIFPRTCRHAWKIN